jgi:hypothetical protein
MSLLNKLNFKEDEDALMHLDELKKEHYKKEYYKKGANIKFKCWVEEVSSNINKYIVPSTSEEIISLLKKISAVQGNRDSDIDNINKLTASIDNKVFLSDDYRCFTILELDYDMINILVENNFIDNKDYIHSPRSSEEIITINRGKNFIRYNKYDKLGKSSFDHEEKKLIVKNYKNKDGEYIKIKKGALYKCDCGCYNPLKKAKVLMSASPNVYASSLKETCDPVCSINEIFFVEVTCSGCNESFDSTEVSYLGQATNDSRVISMNLFNDLEKNGKIVIGNVTNNKTFFGDMYKSQNISNKIVFNVETGRSYCLAKYDIKQRKRIGSIKQLGQKISYTIEKENRISLYNTIVIGNEIEKFLKNKNDFNKKAVIPFNEYLLEAYKHLNYGMLSSRIEIKDLKEILSITNLDDLQSRLKNMLSFYLSYLQRLNILVFYNQNPYIHYKEYGVAASLRSYEYSNSEDFRKLPNKFRNLKKLRDPGIMKKVNELFGVKTKREKAFLKNNHRLLSSYMTIYESKKMFKNQDNVNKILDANALSFNEERYNQYLSIEITENEYLKALIKNFGETTVVNALTKGVVEHNNKMQKKDDNIPSLLTFKIRTSHNNTLNERYYYDTIYNYKKIIDIYPEYELPCSRLRLKDLHDKIASDANKIKQQKIAYEYEEDFMQMYDNKVIDDITFKVALSNTKLVDIGSKMNICVGGYAHSVQSGDIFIVSMEKDSKFIGCLEITKTGVLRQAKGCRNCMLTEDKQIALNKYCLMTNLTVDTRDVYEDFMVKSDSSKEKVVYQKAIKIQMVPQETIKQCLEKDENETENELEAVPF